MGPNTSAGIFTIGNLTGAVIDSNTICSAGVGIRNRGYDTIIRNNILSGIPGATFTGVHEESGGSVAVLQNNCILGFASGIFRDYGLDAYYSTAAEINNVANTTQGAAGSAAGNMSVDPLFVNLNGPDGDIATMADNDWRLQAGSTVKAAGRDLSSLFAIDKNGLTRTVPWSIGAYERD